MLYRYLDLMAFQKESFCTSKGLLLRCERVPFSLRKDSFWIAKGFLSFSD